VYFATEREAVAAGYDHCGHCFSKDEGKKVKERTQRPKR
jgi:hypothetical protein